MGLTKTAFLLLNKGALKGQADIQAVKTDGFLMKVNSLLLELFLKIGYVEDRMLSYMIKGHALILQCRKA
jgi:hypothetical protein